MQPIQQMALVSETTQISPAELERGSAALRTQLARDFGPAWGITATIVAFGRLEDVPPASWPVLVRDDIHMGAAGVHLDRRGQPYALVGFTDQWTLTASHEILEMSADPLGNRLREAPSAKPDQGTVDYLVEVCDPCEAADFAYAVDGILVSDFYTPRYFDPVAEAGVRYSFTGAVSRPREVLRGGYLSWHIPSTDEWWQELWLAGDKPTFKNLGKLHGGMADDEMSPPPDEHEDELRQRAEQLREEIAQLGFEPSDEPSPREFTDRSAIDELRSGHAGSDADD